MDFDNYNLEDVEYDFINLTEKYTGISGILTVNTKFPNQIPNFVYYKSKEDINNVLFIRLSISDSPGVMQDKYDILKNIDDVIIQQIKKWVILNKELLLFIWYGGIDAMNDNELGDLLDLREYYNLEFKKVDTNI